MENLSPRVLGIDPISRGLAFVVLEGPERLIDWGTSDLKTSRVKPAVQRVNALRDKYLPSLLVLENPEESRRGKRACTIIETVSLDAEAAGTPAMVVSRRDVQDRFQHVGDGKYEVALALTRVFPELRRTLPQRREPWNAEDARMGIFDALAFSMTALSILSSFRT